jgi:hypothetical protein
MAVAVTSIRCQSPGNATAGRAPSAPSSPDNRTCSPKALFKAVILSPRDSGDTVEGPICVGVTVNVLRYSVEFGRTVTISAGPNLVTGFTPPTTGGGSVPKNANDLAEALQKAWDDWLAIDRRNIVLSGRVSKAVADLKAVVSTSDDIFRTNGAAAVVNAVRTDQIKTEVQDALDAEWKAADDIYTTLKSLQAAASTLLLGNPSADEKTRLIAIQTQITAYITEVTPSNSAGDKTAAFNKQQAIVKYWSRVISDLKEDSFTKTTYVNCSVSFNQNKQIAVKLIQFDRLPLFENLGPSTAEVRDPFVTVTCASPFSVSAGVEMRFLGNQAFGIVPSGATGANQFNITDNAKTLVLPMGMVHARLAEWSNHRVGINASFGIAAHITSSAAGGSGAEYLTGLSFSLFRTIYITPGWHVGRVSELAGGYKPGDAVPMGVTVTPVRSSYQHGFGLGITFSK